VVNTFAKHFRGFYWQKILICSRTFSR